MASSTGAVRSPDFRRPESFLPSIVDVSSETAEQLVPCAQVCSHHPQISLYPNLDLRPHCDPASLEAVPL